MDHLVSPSRKLALYIVLAVFITCMLAAMTTSPKASAQDAGPSGAVPVESSAPTSPTTGESTADAPKVEKQLNMFSLLISGGYFMIPIGLLSMVVVTFGVERTLGLRRNKVIPEPLVAGLSDLGNRSGGFDPRQAYRLCQQFPSAASHVIRAMLLKVGRPHSEVEHTVKETADREANRMYSNVRWLNLAAGVAPLLGLLGTVWGMIVAFHETTQLQVGQNKADFLAKGIYVALVTTLGGLVVGIAGAVLAHLFEGRIQTLFREIDELLFNLLPQVERYEGRVRFSRQAAENDFPEKPVGEEQPEAAPAATE